jgi:hypothetical protein
VRRLKPEAIFITENPYVSTTPAMLIGDAVCTHYRTSAEQAVAFVPVCALIRWAYYRNGYFGGTARMSMALTSRRHPDHQPAACTDATAHPRRGHHRTTAHTSCSVRSPGKYRPHSRVRRPDTTAPGPRSRLPFLPSTRHTSCRHSTRVGRLAGKVMALLR